MNTTLYHLAAVPFEAARRVDILPAGHRSRALHGHSFLASTRAQVPPGWASFPGGETDLLQERLAAAVQPLDYAFLNDRVPVPTDENLARWVRERLDVPGVDILGVQSTAEQGADLDARGHVHAWRRFRFEAAHQLPNVPPDHQCGRMHGHGFEVILHVDQDLGGRDLGVDFETLGSQWAPLQAELHLNCLNDISGLENPTSEMLAAWIWRRLKPAIPHLSWVTTFETRTCGCHFDGARYRIWKERYFESAVRLTRAPDGDPRRRLHGHSYHARLHLSAPLDEVMGWTVDYGDVKRLFAPVLERLDHRCLDEIAGLRDGSLAAVLHWMRAAMQERLPALDRIDLYARPGCGAALCWGEEAPALPV
jgi:6-pyruvoyltetrahydropterin/6-carboxytetrahydropterin synthase